MERLAVEHPDVEHPDPDRPDVEYLVTMTTRVPDGTPGRDVEKIRTREAAHTRDLAGQGKVLRLWRPPLEPGEWRTIGLFADDDSDDLERTLASMPLRVWRSDEVTPLGTHPNDPGRGRVPRADGSTEYLVTFLLRVPDGTSPEEVAEMNAREADRARELAEAGHLIRLWTTPAPGTFLGLWEAPEPGRLQEILRALPLADWLTVETVALSPHPSDPGSRP
ncbi:muconolactone Delta-isomerase family protein [Promicromonospora sp. NPDC057138]|uniref:muconolactone Delta-isomerase family protein n=1 Tax=Promicromonospora sp. NPDC057138 TaxID=3346031 RepID=UPI0036306BC3